MIALWLVACTGKDASSSPSDSATPTDPPTPTTDTDTDTLTETDTPPTETGSASETGTDPFPTGLNGSVPAVALAAPVFSGVTNRDGTPRTQADLLGHPTVMWFYPAAFTGG